MWTNFQRLQDYRSRDPSGEGRASMDEEDFLQHREWLGKSFIDYANWLQAKNQPAIRAYFEDALQEAPLYPHFYDAQGNNFFNGSLNPLEKGERAVLSPFFMKEASLAQLSSLLPIYEEEGHYFCYDLDTRRYEEIPFDDPSQGMSQLQQSMLTPGQRRALPPNFTALQLERRPGRRGFISAIDPSIAVQERYVPRELGTYKLLLLNLGLDNNNELIQPNQPDSAVAGELQTTMTDMESPWAPEHCQKEHLIEHALADIFKEDPELFETVKQRVDFYFKNWSRYENELNTLRDQNGTLIRDKNWERYLPGPEQMLAYSLMKNIQYLWVNAISSNAFCHHLGLPSAAKYIPLMVGPARYRRAAYADQQGQSFIDVWRKVRGRLVERFPDKKDWVSFSGHGMVVSFDPDLIQKQNERNINHRQLANDIGLAGIDSLHGKEMDLFYRRTL
jgi:hypothetical protein